MRRSFCVVCGRNPTLGLSVQIGRSTRWTTRKQEDTDDQDVRQALCLGSASCRWRRGVLEPGAGRPGRAPPREYRRMQREAPEEVRIEVLRVLEAPVPERPREREIIVEAKVMRIGRSAARIHEGEVIKIMYRHYRGEREVAGAGEPPALQRGRPLSGLSGEGGRRETRLQPGRGPIFIRTIGRATSLVRRTLVSRRKRPVCRRLPPRDRCLRLDALSSGGLLADRAHFFGVAPRGRGFSPSWEQSAS